MNFFVFYHPRGTALDEAKSKASVFLNCFIQLKNLCEVRS